MWAPVVTEDHDIGGDVVREAPLAPPNQLNRDATTQGAKKGRFCTNITIIDVAHVIEEFARGMTDSTTRGNNKRAHVPVPLPLLLLSAADGRGQDMHVSQADTTCNPAENFRMKAFRLELVSLPEEGVEAEVTRVLILILCFLATKDQIGSSGLNLIFRWLREMQGFR